MLSTRLSSKFICCLTAVCVVLSSPINECRRTSEGGRMTLCVGNIIKTSCLMMPKKENICRIFILWEFCLWAQFPFLVDNKNEFETRLCCCRMLQQAAYCHWIWKLCRMWKCRACFVWSENIYIFYTQFPTHACQQFSWSDLLWVWKSSFYCLFFILKLQSVRSFSHFEILRISSFHLTVKNVAENFDWTLSQTCIVSNSNWC